MNPRFDTHTKTRGTLIRDFGEMCGALYELAGDNGGSGSDPFTTPQALKGSVSILAHRFGGYDQQDSHEFLNVLLDGLHNELNVTGASAELKGVKYPPPLIDTPLATALTQTGKPESASIRADKCWKRLLLYQQSIITTLFYGLLQNKTTCAQCSYTSLAFESFSSVSLDLPSSKGKWSLFSAGSVTLAQCFDEFTRVEKLTAGDWFCEKCKARRVASKQLLLWSLPPILFVQLKRFALDGSRVNSAVEYPMELDVKNWCDPTARSATHSAPCAANAAQDLPAFPAYPLAGSSTYRLHSLVLHYGRHRHYTAVTKVRVGKSGEPFCSDVGWAEFDDRIATPIEERNLHSTAAREAVYLLMYVKS